MRSFSNVAATVCCTKVNTLCWIFEANFTFANSSTDYPFVNLSGCGIVLSDCKDYSNPKLFWTITSWFVSEEGNSTIPFNRGREAISLTCKTFQSFHPGGFLQVIQLCFCIFLLAISREATDAGDGLEIRWKVSQGVNKVANRY